jgi:Mce-associated membrane protein
MSMPTPTWYDLLGVEPSADEATIRSAWRTAIADLDPTERRFATLSEAAAVLLDPTRRSAYDAEITPEPPESEAEPDATPEPEHGLDTVAPTPPPAEAEAGARVAEPYLVPGWLLATVGVVAVAAVAIAAILSARPAPAKVVQDSVQVASGSKATEIEEHAVDAVAAAKVAVVPVLSYDYRHLDQDQAAADRYLTDSYRGGKQGYDNTFETLVKKAAVETQTVVSTKVVGAAVVRADSDRVQVLLLIDQPRTNKASPTPVVFQNQVTLTMAKVGSRWLVDDLKTNQIPE